MVGFTPAEHARIAAAIGRAETETSGEIFAVLARESDGYFFPRPSRPAERTAAPTAAPPATDAARPT